MSSLDQRASIAASAHFSDLSEVTAPAAARPMLAQARDVFRVRAEPGRCHGRRACGA